MRAPELDAPPLAYDDYLALPEANRPCEIVDGQVIVSPSPTGRHQRAVVALLRILTEAAPAQLAVMVSPWDWVLRRSPLLVRQPDVLVVTAEQSRADRLTEAPLLAVEVVSATSRERDLVAKRAQYAEAGLPWYWLVDLEVPQILVLRNNGGRLAAVASATGEEHLAVSEPFPARLRPGDLTR
jgi:Uma2 family endonuclease